jgi:hypothetical protein
MMHGIENPHSCFSCSCQKLQHMRDAIISFGHAFDPVPYFATFGDEIVVRIDQQEAGNRVS